MDEWSGEPCTQLAMDFSHSWYSWTGHDTHHYDGRLRTKISQEQKKRENERKINLFYSGMYVEVDGGK